MRRNRGSSVGGGCRRGKHCTSRVIRGQKSILCQQPPFQTHWTVGLVQRPCPSSQIPDFIPVASQEAVNAEALGQAINFFLPSQDFADSPPEGGWRYLSAFEWDGQYQPVNVLLSRACVIACDVSTPAVVYTLENRGASPAPSAAPRFWSLPPKESRPRPLFALPMKAVRSMWKAIPYTSAAMVHIDLYRKRLYFIPVLMYTLISRPLKSTCQRDIFPIECLADFFDKCQKKPHGSSEVVCRHSQKNIHGIPEHTFVKVAS